MPLGTQTPGVELHLVPTHPQQLSIFLGQQELKEPRAVMGSQVVEKADQKFIPHLGKVPLPSHFLI